MAPVQIPFTFMASTFRQLGWVFQERLGPFLQRLRAIHPGVPPFLLKTEDNPEGVDGSVFEGIKKAVAADRYAFFTEFYKNFYNTDQLLGKRVSEEVVKASWNIAVGASAIASLACVPTWHEDFRNDLERVDVPTLVIHGDEDRIVPITAAGARAAKMIKGARRHVVKGSRTASPGHMQRRSTRNCWASSVKRQSSPKEKLPIAWRLRLCQRRA